MIEGISLMMNNARLRKMASSKVSRNLNVFSGEGSG